MVKPGGEAVPVGDQGEVRALTCQRCGGTFTCTRDERCWCMTAMPDVNYIDPVGDCLCPSCLGGRVD